MTRTVVGDPVQTQDGSTVIPISKVSFGFAAGGGEYACSGMQAENELPFAGGAGAGGAGAGALRFGTCRNCPFSNWDLSEGLLAVSL